MLYIITSIVLQWTIEDTDSIDVTKLSDNVEISWDRNLCSSMSCGPCYTLISFNLNFTGNMTDLICARSED